MRRVRLYVVGLLMVAACGVEGTRPQVPATTVPGLELSAGESLLVVGDWGSGTESQREVAEQMADYASRRPVAAIVTTGDNLYSDNVDELMEPFDWARDDDVPFLISWGNHDLDSSRRIEAINDTFDAPRWWTHEWGPVDIVILDSNQIDSRQQRQFLVDAMAESDDPTIVVFHHAPLSCGSHGDTTRALTEWVPEFDDDVFLVLSGHEHNYQRFENDDVTYVVTGGGGQTLTDLADCPDDHPPRIAGEAVHHFVSLELDDTLTVSAIDTDGRVIDEVSLTLP